VGIGSAKPNVNAPLSILHLVSVASSAPAILLAQIAAAIIRSHAAVAAVQLSHTAVVVAKSFGMLEPHVVGSADGLVSESGNDRHHASGYGEWVYSIRARGGAYPDPDAAERSSDELLAKWSRSEVAILVS
jgi:hypothetical protein